jgi:hypothetical protein
VSPLVVTVASVAIITWVWASRVFRPPAVVRAVMMLAVLGPFCEGRRSVRDLLAQGRSARSLPRVVMLFWVPQDVVKVL